MTAAHPSAPVVIDVIVPLYNNERYAVDAITSALTQSLPVRKVIVVDDGSTDRSAEIIERHFATDSRVEVIRAAHGGLPWGRNRGVERSDAGFIAFLDSDDVWYADKLKRQMALFDGKPDTGLVYCGYDDIDSDGKRIKLASPFTPRLRGDVHAGLIGGNRISGGSAALVRREFLVQAGEFDENLSYGEDWDMWLRLAAICRFDYVDAPLFAIRRHAGQMSAGKDYFRKMRRLIQYRRIWAKWPMQVSQSDAVLRVVVGAMMSSSLNKSLSFRRRLAALHVIHKRIIAHTHPRLYRSAHGNDVVLFFRIALRVLLYRLQSLCGMAHGE